MRCFSLLFVIPSVIGFMDSSRPVSRKPTAPLENIELFDQFVFAKNVQPSFLRESELKHGRLAMIGALGMISQELATNAPLF